MPEGTPFLTEHYSNSFQLLQDMYQFGIVFYLIMGKVLLYTILGECIWYHEFWYSSGVGTVVAVAALAATMFRPNLMIHNLYATTSIS